MLGQVETNMLNAKFLNDLHIMFRRTMPRYPKYRLSITVRYIPEEPLSLYLYEHQDNGSMQAM